MFRFLQLRPGLALPMRVFTLVFSIVSIFANCSNHAVWGSQVDVPIQIDELYGNWAFNNFTVERIARLRSIGLTKLAANENTIEIKKDGTCRFNTYNAFHPYGEHLVSDGKWELKRGYDHALERESWYVEFELTPNDYAFVGTRFYLKKRGDVVIMYDFIDDPDQNQFVEFERR